MLELQLDRAALCDLELYIHGALRPGEDFLIAISGAATGDRVLLRDRNNVRLAEMTVTAVADGTASGTLQVIEAPRHADFAQYRLTPAQTKERAGARHAAVIARDFLTVETEEWIRRQSGPCVVHIVEHGPVDHYARMRAALQVIDRYLDPSRAILNLLPFERDDLDTLRQVAVNYGAAAILVPEPGALRPEAAAIAAEAVPPLHKQGFCLWFTGLPSAGKSTIAEQVEVMLRERGHTVTMLDGDAVRMHLSKGLGFSREDRDANIRRIGFVASEVVRHRGIAICAAVSPYQLSRDAVRAMVGEGKFILVHVATPADVCEQRDVKGYYARTRAGAMQGMTGVDDPYEVPTNAEIVLTTSGATPAANAAKVVEWLVASGRLA